MLELIPIHANILEVHVLRVLSERHHLFHLNKTLVHVPHMCALYRQVNSEITFGCGPKQLVQERLSEEISACL